MINQKVRDAMNEQIKHELESFYVYLSMAAWFHRENLDGMAHWMRCQAHEEMEHAMKFVDHINDRDGKVTLLDLKQEKTEWSSPAEVFGDALKHEQFITGKINDLMKLARQEGDYASETLLTWFVGEQIEEEANASRILAQVKMVGDSKQGLLMLDRGVGQRPFPGGSPLKSEG